MPVSFVEVLDQDRLQSLLEAGDLRRLFIEELGWDNCKANLELEVAGQRIRLTAIAQKRDLAVFEYRPESDAGFPSYAERARIEAAASKLVREHLIIFSSHDRHHQVWQWVKREIGRPTRRREQPYHRGRRADLLIQRLSHLAISLEDEDGLTIVDVTGRLKAGFDVEPITKRFYDGFQAEHKEFLDEISGLRDDGVRRWYASIMLNRLMFVYFIQEKGFLDRNRLYLQEKLAESKRVGKDHFFRNYLSPLFFDCLARPDSQRPPAAAKKFGKVPYLNGGLFRQHQIEIANPKIEISDTAFARVLSFFEGFSWHLDERPVSKGNEINPDVLGYIFEKYINQRQMGAYYTKEDVTEYICASTVLPRLLDAVYSEAAQPVGPGALAELLSHDPDRYIWGDLLHGVDLPLPADVAAGIQDESARSEWAQIAPAKFALKKETWSQYLFRRSAASALRTQLRSGAAFDGNSLITLNLNVGQIVQDLLERADEDELALWWKAVSNISVLDPACGSGAFLFAALNVLQPLYETLLDAMESIVADGERFAEAGNVRTSWMRGVLDDIDVHPNRGYFVLKKIALNNLFGVDMMEEAAEICKLRLFLKLVAQIDDIEKIEPLPDLDFNVRVGNSLVGFISRADFDNLKELPLDYESIKAGIEAKSTAAEQQFDVFRKLQEKRDIDLDALSAAKTQLQKSLKLLADECNLWLARQYGKNPGNAKAMGAWLDAYQPFNWFAEFHGVFKNGGFDVVIGNPPYVNRAKVEYEAAAFGEPVFPDIYGNFVLRSLHLRSKEGRCGLIVPLSLTFSEDFIELRERIFEAGSNWISSFDNIPAALFTGVSQRCSIWINAPAGDTLATTPMYRWRADYREHLMFTLQMHCLNMAPKAAYGLPKLANARHERVLELHLARAAQRPERIFGGRTSAYAIGFGAAARNFISIFTELPPELDAHTLKPIEKTKAGFVRLASKKSEDAALASLAGVAFFWYWLVRGDGFDVTSWIVKDFLACLGGLDAPAIELLAEIGSQLRERRLECLVFKKNAGKYVGNLNYRSLSHLTRAADEVLLYALGASRDERRDIYEYVERLRAINEFSGEKAIPDAVKSRFRPNAVNPAVERRILRKAEAYVDGDGGR